MNAVLDWLLAGDAAVRWQVQRDLTDEPWQATRETLPTTGWAAAILGHRSPDGTWPTGWYSPKWTSTFYSLQVVQQLGVPAVESVDALLAKGRRPDGDFSLWGRRRGDTCVTAMMLTMAHEAGRDMPGTVDFLLGEQMPDGGWNCQRHAGATHCSVHTTISVLEALAPFEGRAEVRSAAQAGREVLLQHRLFRSHRTGEVISPAFTRFSFPHYWYYDVLRALDYWRGHPWDERLSEAVDLVRSKQRDGRWPLQNVHPGRTWVVMEEAGRPSRWNTLRALRVLRRFDSSGTDTTHGIA